MWIIRKVFLPSSNLAAEVLLQGMSLETLERKLRREMARKGLGSVPDAPVARTKSAAVGEALGRRIERRRQRHLRGPPR